MDEMVMSGLTHSPTIGELAKALAAARKEFKAVKKDTVNPFFKSKYADLSAVISATEEALARQGLVIVQSPHMNGERISVTTMLFHGSGEWMRDELSLPLSKFDAQGAGSAITYARRYAYQSFVNVAAESDDDANAAVGNAAKTAMPKPPIRGPENGKEGLFAQKFWAGAKTHGKTETAVREYLGSKGFESTSEIPPASQQHFLDWATGTL